MNNSLCTKLCKIVSIYAKTVSNCAQLCQIIPNFIFNDWKLFVPNYAKMFWCVRKCAKLCTTASEIKLYLFSSAENDLCQTVQKCATLFKTVPICNISVQNVRNLSRYLLGNSLAPFYIVKHTYSRVYLASAGQLSTRKGFV